MGISTSDAFFGMMNTVVPLPSPVQEDRVDDEVGMVKARMEAFLSSAATPGQ